MLMAARTKKRRPIRDTAGDRAMYWGINAVLTLFMLVVLYPCIFIVSSSFSSPVAVNAGKVVLWPVDFSLQGYMSVFTHRLIMGSYRNTIVYTACGTALSVSLTLLAAYPLTRRECPLRNTLTVFFVFTMFFGGGLVPTYIVMSRLRLVNNMAAIIVPHGVSVWNMILVRTFMMSSIPEELREASAIDGCGDIPYFVRIVLPLSKPVIAVISLYTAVGVWNAYFSAMIYLSDERLYPLQLICRQILVMGQNQLSDTEMLDAEALYGMKSLQNLLKYALIVVSTVPILVAYPFVQKFFIKGVMIGSLKG